MFTSWTRFAIITFYCKTDYTLQKDEKSVVLPPGLATDLLKMGGYVCVCVVFIGQHLVSREQEICCSLPLAVRRKRSPSWSGTCKPEAAF